MEQFNIWGQVQEVAGGRYLVIAMACPLESGRQMSFSKVVRNREDANASLEDLIEQLRRQLASSGDNVVGVHQLQGHMPSNDFPPRDAGDRDSSRRGAL
jgi:hypothetical protein